ncbi:DUF4468 domain-containing protein [Pedobacter nototheniae]|uniref:DUF4468 domain-containing protein n=1 Tax=Pedobacter nototheniae TaxID=2488994 RepID=UPI00103BA96B|nr:DUF4468 domain-containing protein [Pedobacter nototheniae]
MKKILLLILIFPFILKGQELQKLQLNYDGFSSVLDSTKKYVIIDIPNKSKADLYKKSQVYFSKLYVNPKEVMTLIDGESITLNGIDKKAVKMKVLYLNPSWDVNYTSTYEFKDNKVRISFSVNRLSTYTGDIFREKMIGDFFNKKGIVRDEKSVKTLNEYVNSVIETYYKSMIKSDDENW